MNVNDAIEFQKLVLMSGLRESAPGDLREILDCVMFYSSMCGCNPEAKDLKYYECNLRYRNFLNNNLNSVKDRILEHFPEVSFYFEGQPIVQISR